MEKQHMLILDIHCCSTSTLLNAKLCPFARVWTKSLGTYFSILVEEKDGDIKVDYSV